MAPWTELSPDTFSSTQPIFAGTHYCVLAAGTLEGGHPGRVFVDDPACPRAGLICTRVGYSFLAGAPSAAHLDGLYALFTGELIPRQKVESGNPEALLFFDPPGLGDALLARFAGVRPLRIFKKRHTFPAGALAGLKGWRSRLPEDMRIAPYSAALLAAQPALAEEPELFYGSVEAFLQKSFGLCVLDGETIASSICGVFIGGGEIEISIQTSQAYRRRGLAYLTAAAFIEASLERGLNPIWGCWPENEPSMRLAEKLGFVEDCDQPACFWVDDAMWNPAGG